jgi:dTDP-glucose 4,6-dehydratase
VNLDCLSYSGNLENLSGLEEDPRYRFVHGNILDFSLAERLLDSCDAIVHFAAESHVDRSIKASRPFIESNVLGTQTLLDAARKVWNTDSRHCRRFVQVSTDEVYGSLPLDQPDQRFTETSPIDCSSPYSASKAAADLLVQAYRRTFGLNVIITRCSNNFGPFQFPEKVIPLFITNLLENRRVPLYGDGRNVRDWLHVEDHCEAILAVLERGRAGEVYNIGGDNERSNLELTHAILELMGRDKSSIQFVSDRPGHDLRYAIDSSKIRRELNWMPIRSRWPDAIRETIDWYVANEDWWLRVKSGEYRQYYKQQYAEL